MLSDPPALESVYGGSDGLLAGCRKGIRFVDMSTILPSTARRVTQAVREKGADGLDAPVSGGQVGAQNATLSIMVGGSAAACAPGFVIRGAEPRGCPQSNFSAGHRGTRN